MLKTNSKQARENLKKYILAFTEEITGTSKHPFLDIYNRFEIEAGPHCEYNRRRPESETFKEWAQGLPMNGLFCYYYSRSAVEDLARILDETAEEASRFTEQQAEEMLTKLIYARVKSEAAREEMNA